MTNDQLKAAFIAECTAPDKNGNPVVKGTPEQIADWIADKFCAPPFSRALTGMHDKRGTPIREGDHVRLYHKGEYVVCRVVYDPKNAAFLIRWPDGYINQYFMNGGSYEVVDAPNS